MNRERLVSVDAFRGATVAAMILVNNPGDWDFALWWMGKRGVHVRV